MKHNKEDLNKHYNSPYPSEITYKSDKNFLVRLKAALDRNMRDLGYNINSDQHKELIERMNDAEDWFFESKITSLPVTGESEAIEKAIIEELESLLSSGVHPEYLPEKINDRISELKGDKSYT